MRIADILKSKQTFSYEIFPPKGDMSVVQATDVAERLMQNSPDWISVTFSAGGSGNSQNTVSVAKAIQASGKTQALAHLTCLGSSRADVDAYAEKIKAAGVQNVLALRGDRAPGRDVIDFEHASDLVAYLKQAGLCVGAACYPEGHLESSSPETDIEHLKAKVDAGADFLVTQLFFDNEDFYRFERLCREAGITVPIIPGLKPISTVKQVEMLPKSFSIDIPRDLTKEIAAHREDKQAVYEIGQSWCKEQCRDLIAHGAPAVHFYTMGKAANIVNILKECC